MYPNIKQSEYEIDVRVSKIVLIFYSHSMPIVYLNGNIMEQWEMDNQKRIQYLNIFLHMDHSFSSETKFNFTHALESLGYQVTVDAALPGCPGTIQKILRCAGYQASQI